jgi:hypothetical protein
MAAGVQNITIRKDEDFAWNFEIQTEAGAADDITGRTYAADIKSSADAVVDSFTVTVTSAAGGTLTLSLTETETAALTAGEYRWHLTETNGTTVTVLVVGRCFVVTEAG